MAACGRRAAEASPAWRAEHCAAAKGRRAKGVSTMLLLLPVSIAAAIAAAAAVTAPAAVAHMSCPDKIMPGTGIGGGGRVTALANVSSQADCCALCHGDYHDECTGWVYGPTPGVDSFGGEGYQKHNCAIMATNGPPKAISNHVTGITKDAPPPPSPPSVGKPCNADINCAPTTAANWRCKQHTAAPAADNNCHIPGPGTRGNNTCACTVQLCKPTPAGHQNATATQYLVIGDSISMGMNKDLSALVAADGWQLTHNPGNAASSNLGAHCIRDWVNQAGGLKWGVISYQFGLHDLGPSS